MPPNGKKNGGQNIQVSVRCRPLSHQERRQGSCAILDANSLTREIIVREKLTSHLTKKFTFDHVFSTSSTQIDIYKSVVSPVIDEVLQGYNCTVFAYGQTGTGKTFTMEGERTNGMEDLSWEKDPLAGVIPRAMKHIFDCLISTGSEFSVRVSYVELYNEELFDLLSVSDEPLKLKIYDDASRKGSTIIQGLDEVLVHNKDDVYRILETGAARRRTAMTLLNDRSSRSHAVFSVTVHIKESAMEGDELLKIGKLNLVDLAGSENIARSGAIDKRAREAGNINQSLLTLGRVITALVEHTPHIPYRESKLTRMLQDSLGGKTKTSIIATISPAACNYEETMSTLDYAFRAKNVTNRPEVNQRLNKKTLLKEYTEEMERMRRDLQASREKNGIYISEENYESTQNRLTMQADLIKEHEETIVHITDEKDKMTALFTTTQAELDSMNAALALTLGDLEATKTELREEQFVSQEQLKTQERLTHEAVQILDTANSSVLDVSLLHDKLGRTRAVEGKNTQSRHAFISSLDGLVSKVTDTVQRTTSDHVAHVRQTAESLGQMIERERQQGETRREVIQTTIRNVQAISSGIDAECVKAEEARASVDGHITAQSLQVGVLQGLLNEYRNVTQKIITQASSSTEEFLAANKRYGQYIEQRDAEMTVRIESDMDTIVHVTRGVMGELREYTRLSHEHHEGYMNELVQIGANHERDHQIIMEVAAARTRDLQSLKDKQERSHHQLDMVISSTSKMESLGTIGEDIKTYMTTVLSEDTKQRTNHSAECTQVRGTVKTKHDDLKSRCEGFTTQAVELSETMKCDTSANFERHRQRHSDCSERHEECKVQLDSINTGLQRQHETSEREVNELRAELTSVTASLDTLIMDLEAAQLESAQRVTDVHKTTTAHVTGTKIDVPTGHTPQRREFVYPKVVYKAPSRSTLLESFRNVVTVNVKEGVSVESEEFKPEVDAGQEGTGEEFRVPEDVSDTRSDAGASDASGATYTSGISSMSEVAKENRSKSRKVNHKTTPSLRSKLPLRCSNNN